MPRMALQHTYLPIAKSIFFYTRFYLIIWLTVYVSDTMQISDRDSMYIPVMNTHCFVHVKIFTLYDATNVRRFDHIQEQKNGR